jgi:hypothetical protein
MKRTKQTKSGDSKAADAGGPSPETLLRRIAERAFERYEARGYVNGHDLDDWLEAEQEVVAEMQRAAKPRPAGPQRSSSPSA